MNPLPHLVTILRREMGDHELQYANAEETIDTHVKALISPASATLQDTVGGPAPVYQDMIFLEPGVDVQGGDVLMDEDSEERWQVISPPKTLQNPITWEDDHIEVMVARDTLT